MRKISRAGRWSALLIAVTLMVTGCTDDAEKPVTGQVDLDALRTIAAGLPADPAEAAVRLVAEVYGDSPERLARVVRRLPLRRTCSIACLVGWHTLLRRRPGRAGN